MPHPPLLRTARLTLRPFTPEDAPVIQTLAGAYEVALNTLMIPHPYPDGAAAEWISKHEEDFEEDRIHHFAIDDGRLLGAIGLVIRGNRIGELGYWIGVPYWGRGYVTEAAAEVMRYAFEDRDFHRVFANHFARNPGSGRVLEKIGMVYEGTLRQHVFKWGEYLDMAMYGLLREEWLAARRSA